MTETIIPARDDDDDLECSFCGRLKGKLDLVALPRNMCICDDCVSLCQGIIDFHREQKE